MLLDTEKEKFKELLFNTNGFDKRIFEKYNLIYSEKLEFKNDLGFDSLDALEFITQVEFCFQIEITDKIAEKITNVGEAYTAIYDAQKRKEYSKENLILAWEQACEIKDLSQAQNRINAIKYQFQRNAWEIVSTKGKLRIQSVFNESSIMIWPFASMVKTDFIKYDISEEEYQYLKGLYFDGLEDI